MARMYTFFLRPVGFAITTIVDQIIANSRLFPQEHLCDLPDSLCIQHHCRRHNNRDLSTPCRTLLHKIRTEIGFRSHFLHKNYFGTCHNILHKENGILRNGGGRILARHCVSLVALITKVIIASLAICESFAGLTSSFVAEIAKKYSWTCVTPARKSGTYITAARHFSSVTTITTISCLASIAIGDVFLSLKLFALPATLPSSITHGWGMVSGRHFVR